MAWRKRPLAFLLMVRSAKRVSNHEATTRASSFERQAAPAPQDEGYFFDAA
jgi:hypothetical protein